MTNHDHQYGTEPLITTNSLIVGLHSSEKYKFPVTILVVYTLFKLIDLELFQENCGSNVVCLLSQLFCVNTRKFTKQQFFE